MARRIIAGVAICDTVYRWLFAVARHWQGVAGSGSPLEFEAANKAVTAHCKAVKELQGTLATLELAAASPKPGTSPAAMQKAQVRAALRVTGPARAGRPRLD
jgi:hypothetical protein